MTRVAVTGASGFVGTSLVAGLVAQGHDVRGLSRFRTSQMQFPGAGKFEGLVGDVRNPEAVRELLAGAECVVHLAASTHADDPVEDIIVRGTGTLLALVDEKTRFVWLGCLGADASSHSEYYRAKWRADLAVRSSSVPHVIVRSSLIVGPGDGVIEPLVRLIRTRPAVPLVREANALIQPIAVDDLVRCLLAVIESDDLLGAEIAVGGPTHLTFSQLVDTVGAARDVTPRTVSLPAAWLRFVLPLLPPDTRTLYSPLQLAAFEHGVVVSPGVVERNFGFKPKNIADVVAEIGG